MPDPRPELDMHPLENIIRIKGAAPVALYYSATVALLEQNCIQWRRSS